MEINDHKIMLSHMIVWYYSVLLFEPIVVPQRYYFRQIMDQVLYMYYIILYKLYIKSKDVHVRDLKTQGLLLWCLNITRTLF